MVTGFIKLNGMTVGAVANCTTVYDEEGKESEKFDNVLSAKGCEKAAEFVNFCDSFNIPVLTLTNVKGYKATVCAEKHIAKAAAKLTYAFANATVPKVNVVIGEDSASIGMMDASMAAKIMYADKPEVISEKASEYAALQTSAVSAAKRGYVDSIIAPADTRKYVIGAFEMLYSKKEDRPSKKHGTV